MPKRNRVSTPIYRKRLEKLQAVMLSAGADVFVCDHAEMLAWLTGYAVSETFYRACVVPLDAQPVWVLRRIDEVPCRARTWVNEVVTYADYDDAHACVAGVVQRFAPNTLAADFSSYGFTLATYNRFRELLPAVPWIDLPSISNTLRAVKDDAEIALIKKAAEIGDGAMAALVGGVKTGMRPRDASAIAAAHYLKHGADDYWVGPISISRRSGNGGHDMGFLHTELHDDHLTNGDILHVELVPRVQYYSARFMRSLRLGDPSSEENAVMQELVALQDAQLAAIRPGVEAQQVDAILRHGVLRAGLREEYSNITGYQTGLYARTPRSSDTSLCLHPNAQWAFEENQVFHLYATAQGLAVSETVIVKADGVVRCHNTERALLVVAC